MSRPGGIRAYGRLVTSPQLSRRAVLTAGAVGAAALLGGCTSGSTLTDGVLQSRHWPSGGRRWRLAVPSKGTALGLLVALHGHGGDADSAFDLGLADHVDQTRLAVVSVDGGNTYWHARTDGSDTGAMVREELIPLALKRSGLPAATPVALYGWSMGGFGALLLASDMGPQRVSCVVAASAALWTDGGQTPAGAYDDREDFERHSIFGRTDRLKEIPVRLDCGSDDPFIAANRELAPLLANVMTRFDTGGHTEDYWSSHAEDEMGWAAAT